MAGRHGYTLVELVVVLALMGTLLGFVVPRIETVLPGGVENTAVRWLTTTPRMLKQKALSENRPYALVIDKSLGRAWISHRGQTEAERLRAVDAGIRLPASLQVRNPATDRNGGLSPDRWVVQFHPNGTADGAVIDLTDADGSEQSLLIEPFLPAVKVVRGHWHAKAH